MATTSKKRARTEDIRDFFENEGVYVMENEHGEPDNPFRYNGPRPNPKLAAAYDDELRHSGRKGSKYDRSISDKEKLACVAKYLQGGATLDTIGTEVVGRHVSRSTIHSWVRKWRSHVSGGEGDKDPLEADKFPKSAIGRPMEVPQKVFDWVRTELKVMEDTGSAITTLSTVYVSFLSLLKISEAHTDLARPKKYLDPFSVQTGTKVHTC